MSLPRLAVVAVLASTVIAGFEISSQAVQPSVEFSVAYGSFSTLGADATTVGGDGSTYLTGTNHTFDPFPVTSDAAQKKWAGMWVAKVDAAGTRLVWATYVGGVASRIRVNLSRDQTTVPSGIAVDGEGNVYVTGATVTTDFPVVNAVIAGPRGPTNDGFLVKLSPDGSRILYSTYLGVSNSNVFSSGVAVDGLGNAYVGLSDVRGRLSFETHDVSVPGRVGSLVLVKANPAGGIVYATRFGDGVTDRLGELAVDGSGALHLIGSVLGKTFAAALDPSGSKFVYSATMSGTTGVTAATSIATDAAGNAFVAGTTTSTDLPVLNALQSSYGGNGDWFLTKLDPSGSPVFSTYLGGPGEESRFGRAPQVLVDGAGQPTLVGFTASREYTAGMPLERPDVPAYGSLDGGVTWQPRANGLKSEVDAFAATKSGTRLWYAGTQDGVFTSTDLGDSWQPASDGLGSGPDRTTCRLAVDPAHPGTVYAGTRGGTYKSSDYGLSWSQVEPTRIFGCLWPFGAALAVDGSGVVFIGSGHGIHRSGDSGLTWEDASTGLTQDGDGSYPEIRTTLFAPNQAGVIYATDGLGTLYRSANGGSLWVPIHQSPSSWRAVIVPFGRPHYVYTAAGPDFLESGDDGRTWSFVARQSLCEIAISPTQPGLLLGLGCAGSFTRSVDVGRSWTTLGAGVLPARVTSVGLDPLDANTIFVGAPTISDMPLLIALGARANRVRFATYLDRWPPNRRVTQDVTGAYYVATAVNSKQGLVKLRFPEAGGSSVTPITFMRR